jgi:hypothetical protein
MHRCSLQAFASGMLVESPAVKIDMYTAYKMIEFVPNRTLYAMRPSIDHIK